ncbi:MAG: hypothetical protein TREMPRED_004575 [Tremellales sp. Tagirdzhanova-0007]|nr:MAG: hypothetical protein TREMPRED_004575 [Tremellales sp. Tagirdzhanova-0007]
MPWLLMTKAAVSQRDDNPGVGITLLAPELTGLQADASPGHAAFGGLGSASWHLGFNDTYLSQEFAYFVKPSVDDSGPKKVEAGGDDEIYAGECTIAMTASPTALFEVNMQTASPWISINTDFYNTVTAQCGDNTATPVPTPTPTTSTRYTIEPITID